MLNTTKKSIVQIVFVISYERDSKIRTKQFEIEKALSSLLECRSVNTNLPDDFKPQVPRVTLTKGKVSINFSQIATQLTIDVDNTKGQSIEVIQDSLIKKINLFQSCVDKIIPHEQQREHGLVLTVNYPIDSTKFSEQSIFEYIQRQFLQISPLGSPASASFNVGYKTDDNFFITLSVGDYKMVLFGADDPMTQWVDVSKLTVKESGIELKIDINSKPMADTSNRPTDVTDTILKKSFDFVLNKSDKFMGIQQ